MFKNYLKVTLRNLQREKGYSLINLSGLVLGLTIFLLFLRIAIFGLSFDTFHQNANRIYGIVQVFQSSNQGEQHSSLTPSPLLPAMQNEFPEIEDAVRFFPAKKMIVRHQDQSFYENGILFVDHNFLTFFTYDIIIGESKSILSEPSSIVLTETCARKYFGDEYPLGKVLTLDNKIDVTVSGIIEDIPSNSSIRFDCLVPMETAQSLFDWIDEWTVYNQAAFVRLPEGYHPAQLEEKFEGFLQAHFPNVPDSPRRLYLFPLLDFYLYSVDITSYMGSTGPVTYYLLLAMGAVFLLIVCINHMNLATARYSNRLKEIGMRKVVGANRVQVIKQFIGESVFMNLLALPVAIVLYDIARQAFLAQVGDNVDLSLWTKPMTLVYLLIITIFVGILAGSYPALFLSSFKPATILKGKTQSGKNQGRFRRLLVIIQFGFSIILIVFTLVLLRQADHIYRVNLGYNRDGVVVVPISGESQTNLQLIKENLIQHPDILMVSALPALPGFWDTEHQVIPEGGTHADAWIMNVYGADYDFNKVLDIPVVQGRTFSKDHVDKNNFIINESAVQLLNWTDPIGKKLTIGNKKGAVIGIVKDFHFKDIHYPISPTVLRLEKENLNYMLIKASSIERIPNVTEYIKSQWQIVAPNVPFESYTLEQHFRWENRGTEIGAEIIGAVGAIAIFFSCLGLLGLASYTVRQRTKEIGVRKVLGATFWGIVTFLIKDFIKLIIIANFVTLPVAYFISHKFIQFGFAFQTKISIMIFIFAVVTTLLSAFVSIIFQTLRAALAKPVENLRYE